MDFALSEEQTIFRESVTRFLADRYPFPRRQEIVATAAGFLDDHWSSFAELGWLAAPFPEAYGGLDGSPVEVMLVMEQFGRCLMASPYLASVVLGGHLVLFGGSEEQRSALLPALAEGRLQLAFAFAERGARYELADVATRARKDGNGYRIDGEKCAVFYAAAADKLIVSARTGGGRRDADGLSLFLVDRGANGLSPRHHATHDGGRASDLRFDGVRVGGDDLLGPLDGAGPIIERVVDHGIAAVSAEADGAMWSVYERTLDYLKTRRQFGQVLGSFQALQHRMVDVYLECELTRSLVLEATLALGDPDPAARMRAASAAKARIAAAGRHVGQEGVQLHGGIGMTMDLPIGHYLKRLTMINATFGDRRHHLDRYRALAVAAAGAGPG